MADYNQLNRGEWKNKKLQDQVGQFQIFGIYRQQGRAGYIKYALDRLKELGAA